MGGTRPIEASGASGSCAPVAEPDTGRKIVAAVSVPEDASSPVSTAPVVRRRLRRCDNDEVFAYAKRGHDFFRACDHVLWAQESGDLLLSARSGTPLACRAGDVFCDLESKVPLYYEDHGEEPPPGPRSPRAVRVGLQAAG